jgi:hypothetical protein
MSKVVGTFSSRDSAQSCIDELKSEGFTSSNVSIVSRDDSSGGGGGNADSGMGGATTGGLIGGAAGLLAGVGALAVPGIGPLLAAGPIAATLTGAVGGGLLGGLIDMGIPEDRSEYYEGQVKGGKVLAMVEASSARVDKAAQIMRRHGASDVETH